MIKKNLGFFISIIFTTIIFIYLGFIRFGQIMGYHGILPPILAAWIGNITFGLMGIGLVFHVQK